MQHCEKDKWNNAMEQQRIEPSTTARRKDISQRSTRRNRLQVGIGISVVALLLAACGTSQAARKAPTQRVKAKTVKVSTAPAHITSANNVASATIVTAAVKRTLAARTVSLLLGLSPSSLSIQTDGKVVQPPLLAPSNGPGAPTQGIISYQLHGAGTFDFANTTGEFQLGTPPTGAPAQPANGTTSQWILTSKFAYQAVPKIPSGPASNASKTAVANAPAWIRIPLSTQPTGGASATAGPSSFTFEVFSPLPWLTALSAIKGSVTKEGSGSFRGKAVTYYETTVPAPRLQFLATTGQVRIEVAIDASGLIREIAAVVPAPSSVSPSSTSPPKAQGGFTAMLVTIGLSHFGAPVAISVPPASQTDTVLNPAVARQEHAAHPNGTSTGTPATPSPAPSTNG